MKNFQQFNKQLLTNFLVRKTNVGYIWLFFGVILVGLVAASIGCHFCSRNSYSIANEMSEPERKYEDSGNDSDLTELTSADERKNEIEKFLVSSELTLHGDLQEVLESQEVQSAYLITIKKMPEPYESSRVHDRIWVVESVEKSYLLDSGGIQNEKPRSQYVVTANYWNPLDSPFYIECWLDKPVVSSTIYSENSEIVLVLKRNWNCPSQTTLINYTNGQIIPFSDPDNLVPDNYPYIVTDTGTTGGMFEKFIFGNKLLIQVYFGNAIDFGHGYFEARTGKLVDLVLFE